MRSERGACVDELIVDGDAAAPGAGEFGFRGSAGTDTKHCDILIGRQIRVAGMVCRRC